MDFECIALKIALVFNPENFAFFKGIYFRQLIHSWPKGSTQLHLLIATMKSDFVPVAMYTGINVVYYLSVPQRVVSHPFPRGMIKNPFDSVVNTSDGEGTFFPFFGTICTFLCLGSKNPFLEGRDLPVSFGLLRAIFFRDFVGIMVRNIPGA